MTGRERRLLRMLCMTAGGGGGGDKPWEEMTWDDVIAATKNGKYKNFEIGAMKELDLGSEGIVQMQIVGIDADELADGSGYAPLTFISKELLKTNRRMNPILAPSAAPYDEGTGTIGGWGQCDMRTYLKTTVMPLIPETVRSAIVSVAKYSDIYNTSGTSIVNSATADDVWIPSEREVFLGEDAESLGPIYNGIFADSGNLIKISVKDNTAHNWWLRTAYSNTNYRVVGAKGIKTGANSIGAQYIALGFCL